MEHEAPPHTPAGTAKKCEYCKQRLRSKNNTMHRKCEQAYYNPPKPPAPYVPKYDYPPSRYCDACRRLDNSMFPASVCRACGAPTRVQMPGLKSPEDPRILRKRRRRNRKKPPKPRKDENPS
jgi:hypothetical protein